MKSIFSSIIAIALIILLAIPVSGANENDLSYQLSLPSEVKRNRNFTVDVNIKTSGKLLSAAVFSIYYDNSLVEYRGTSVKEGFSNITFDSNNQDGIVTVAFVSKNGISANDIKSILELEFAAQSAQAETTMTVYFSQAASTDIEYMNLHNAVAYDFSVVSNVSNTSVSSGRIVSNSEQSKIKEKEEKSKTSSKSNKKESKEELLPEESNSGDEVFSEKININKSNPVNDNVIFFVYGICAAAALGILMFTVYKYGKREKTKSETVKTENTEKEKDNKHKE